MRVIRPGDLDRIDVGPNYVVFLETMQEYKNIGFHCEMRNFAEITEVCGKHDNLADTIDELEGIGYEVFVWEDNDGEPVH